MPRNLSESSVIRGSDNEYCVTASRLNLDDWRADTDYHASLCRWQRLRDHVRHLAIVRDLLRDMGV